MEKVGKAIVKLRIPILILSVLLLIPAGIGYVKTKVCGTGAAAHGVVEHQSQDGCPPHAYLFRHDNGGLHILYNRVQPEDIPLYAVVLYRVYKMCFQLSAIALAERLSGKLQ